MKRNKLYILPLILSLFWGLTSCEDDSSIESAGTGSVSGITLKLSMPSSVASRAVEEPGEEALNENTIKSLDVFVYREGAGRQHREGSEWAVPFPDDGRIPCVSR